MSNPYEGDSATKDLPGIKGTNTDGGDGTWGYAKDGRGVVGISGTHTGVEGNSTDGDAVFGQSKHGRGVVGIGLGGGAGVVGDSQGFDGVLGVSHNVTAAGVSGHNPGGLAGFFEGNVVVSGSLTVQNVDILANINNIHQQISSLQQQLSSLQQKENSDVQGIAQSLVTLAARVTALGG
jgi:hypothetical protein